MVEFVCFCMSRPLKFMRPRSVLLTSTRFGRFRKKYQKSSNNPAETCPKSRKNRRKIEKNQKNLMEKAKMSEENQQMRYKCEKYEKSANLRLQNQKSSFPDGMANPHSLLRKERNPSVTLRKPIQVSLTNLNHQSTLNSTRVCGSRTPAYLCGRRRRGGGPQAALPRPAARRAPAAAATAAQIENFCEMLAEIWAS